MGKIIMIFYLHETLLPHFKRDEAAFDQLMSLPGEEFRALEGRSTRRITLHNKTYFIKTHSGIGLREIFKNWLQFKRPVLSAENEWLAIQHLQTLGITVPQLFAYGKRGHHPARLQSFVLMEELAPAISLEHLCAKWVQSPPTFAFKKSLIQEVARIARTLHENGINHRDFYLCHFLLLLKEPDQPKLGLIDLHRAQIRRLTPRRWIIKDLVGLYFSSKGTGLTSRDWYRFMIAYRNQPLREILASETAFWQKVKKRGEQLFRDHV
jgi:heptose I phosphotransferase